MRQAQTPAPIPILPRPLAMALGLPPLAPLSMALSAFARHISRQHPGLFRRLGEYDQARFILDPTDLPFVLCLEPRGGAPKVSAHRKDPGGDARIAGPLAALLGLVHGAYDGDALFFSRDLVIEGDTSAALALRNALDDAELDFMAQLDALPKAVAGPLKELVQRLEKFTGVALSRPEDLAW